MRNQSKAVKRFFCKKCNKPFYDASPYDTLCIECWNKKEARKKGK